MHRPPRIAPQKTSASPASNLSTNPQRFVSVRAEPIELCQLLKFAGLADSGGSAKQLISEGKVLLNGVVETQKRKKVKSGDKVTLGNESIVVRIG